MRRCLSIYDEETCQKQVDFYMYLDSLYSEEDFEEEAKEQALKDFDVQEKIKLGYLVGIPMLFVLGSFLNILAIVIFAR